MKAFFIVPVLALMAMGGYSQSANFENGLNGWTATNMWVDNRAVINGGFSLYTDQFNKNNEAIAFGPPTVYSGQVTVSFNYRYQFATNKAQGTHLKVYLVFLNNIISIGDVALTDNVTRAFSGSVKGVPSGIYQLVIKSTGNTLTDNSLFVIDDITASSSGGTLLVTWDYYQKDRIDDRANLISWKAEEDRQTNYYVVRATPDEGKSWIVVDTVWADRKGGTRTYSVKHKF